MKLLLIATAMAISALAMGQPASARMLHHHYSHMRAYNSYGYGAWGSGDAYRVGAQRGLKRHEPAYMYRQDQGVKRGD